MDAGETDAGGLDAGVDGGADSGAPDAGEPASSCPTARFVVADYGAVPSSGDAAIGIRAAMAAAEAAGGGVLVFEPGTYNIRSTELIGATPTGILVTASNLIFEGRGAVLRIADGLEPRAAMLIIGRDRTPIHDVHLRDLTIDPNWSVGNTARPSIGVMVWDAVNVQLVDVSVTDAYTAISFEDNASHGLLRRVAVRDLGEDGFSVSGGRTEDPREPRHIVFDECTATGSGRGNDWEIEDGAHHITTVDSVAERWIEVRNHAFEDRFTREAHFLRTRAGGYHRVWARDRDTAGDPITTNRVEDISFFDVPGLIWQLGPVRNIRVENDAPTFAEGTGRLDAGATTTFVMEPAASDTAVIVAAATTCTGGRSPTVGAVTPGVGFEVSLPEAHTHAITFDWWLAD